MKFWQSTVGRTGLGSFAVLLLASVAGAHEPVFSVGPETIFQGGVGAEVGLDFESAGSEQTYGLDYELIYGIFLTMTHIQASKFVPRLNRSKKRYAER